jgi:hypothetical protein
MGPRSIAGNRLSLIVRAALLLVGLSTYLIFPDDVVWRFIKTAPHARVWEHALFGIAAAILGFALLLKVKASVHPENQDSHVLLESQPPLPAYCRQSELDHCCLYLASYCLYLAMWPPVCFCMADIRLRKIPELTGTLAEPAGRRRVFDGETLWPHT